MFYLGIFICLALIYSGFAVIALMIIVFLGIWVFGLRDKFPDETTASAYSVFNKDGRAIVGGFTASQFESQLRGPLATISENDPLKGPIAESRRGNYERAMSTLSIAERRARRIAAATAAEGRLTASKED